MLLQFYQKVKSWVIANKTDLYVAILIFLVGMASFGLGRLSILWPLKEPITIEEPQTEQNMTVAKTLTKSNQQNSDYVASKSGSYYYLPWCAGAFKIKDQNKVWFKTKEEAEGRGYKPALACSGLNP